MFCPSQSSSISFWAIPGRKNQLVIPAVTMCSVRCQKNAQDTEKTQIFCGLVGFRQVGMYGSMKWIPKWGAGCKTPQYPVGFGSEPIRSGRGISSWFLGTILCSQPRFSPRSFVLVEETNPKDESCRECPSAPGGVFTQIFTSSSGTNIPGPNWTWRLLQKCVFEWKSNLFVQSSRRTRLSDPVGSVLKGLELDLVSLISWVGAFGKLFGNVPVRSTCAVCN